MKLAGCFLLTPVSISTEFHISRHCLNPGLMSFSFSFFFLVKQLILMFAFLVFHVVLP